MAKKNDFQDVKKAARVAKKTATTAKKGKKLCKRSGFQKALPYISILLAVVLALCFILALGSENNAGVVGLFVQQLFCGLLGGAAYFLPAVLLFTGILWCVLHFKYRPSDAREGSERLEEFLSAQKKAVSKTVLCFLALFILGVIFGIFEAMEAGYDSYEFTTLWEYAANGKTFISGGIVGGSFAYIFMLAFKEIISLVILFILLIFVILFIIGLTPRYIYNKIQCRRELSKQTEDFDEEEDERRMEALRAKELEKAKKRRQREHIAEQKREARAYAAAYEFEDEELQPPQKQKQAPSPGRSDDDDILLDGIGISEQDTEDDDDILIVPPM